MGPTSRRITASLATRRLESNGLFNRLFFLFRSPTPPGSSKITWRQFTKDEQFYIALDVKPRLKQRFRASQVAFWNVTSKIGRRGRKGKTTPRSYL